MKKIPKLIIAMLVFLFLIGGSLTVVFANSSVTDVLSEWFTDKTEESIQEIEQEIQEEQAKQTERLKEVLAEEVAKLETDFEVFLEAEKEKRLHAIEAYAEERMQEIPEMMNEEDRKEEIKTELEIIFQDAIEAMDQVNMEYEELTEEEDPDS